jgi:RNA polymerase sigma-70 factor (ECF subfamily)
MRLNASPIVALNRAIAVAQRDGPERGLETIKAIPNADRLDGYPFYPAAVGELLVRAGSVERAREYFEQALARARNPVERRFFEQKLAADLPGARSTAMPFWESSFESSQESDDEH